MTYGGIYFSVSRWYEWMMSCNCCNLVWWLNVCCQVYFQTLTHYCLIFIWLTRLLCWCYTDSIEHLSLCCAWAWMTGSKIVTVQENWKILCFCLFVVDNATKSIMSYVQKQWCVAPSIFCPIAVKIHLIQLSPWSGLKKNNKKNHTTMIL